MLGIVLMSALLFSAEAQVQTVPPEKPAEPSQADKPVDTEPADIGTEQQPSRRIAIKPSFEISIAPEVTDDSTLPNRTDSTTVGWRLRLEPALIPGWTLKLGFGPTATIDTDHDSRESSRLVGSASLRGLHAVEGFVPVFLYEGSRLYERFFDAENGWEHKFDFSLERTEKFFFRRSAPRLPDALSNSLRIVVGAQRLALTESNKDYWSLRLQNRLTIPVFGDRIDMRFDANVEHRWYNNIDLVAGGSRRDLRLEAGAGIDLARPVNAYLNRETRPNLRSNWISEFFIGGSWINIRSNLDTEDRSNFRFVPIIKLAIPLN